MIGLSCYQLGGPGRGLNSTLNLPRVSNAVCSVVRTGASLIAAIRFTIKSRLMASSLKLLIKTGS